MIKMGVLLETRHSLDQINESTAHSKCPPHLNHGYHLLKKEHIYLLIYINHTGSVKIYLCYRAFAALVLCWQNSLVERQNMPMD